MRTHSQVDKRSKRMVGVRTPCGLWLFVFLLTGVAAALTGDARKEEQAVRKLLEAWTTAFNRHDAGSGAALFDREADVIVLLSRYQGREQIEEMFASSQGTIIGSPAETASIRFLKSDVAIADMDVELEGVKGADGEELPVLLIQAVIIAVKNDRGWVFGALRVRIFASAGR